MNKFKTRYLTEFKKDRRKNKFLTQWIVRCFYIVVLDKKLVLENTHRMEMLCRKTATRAFNFHSVSFYIYIIFTIIIYFYFYF